MPEFKQIYQDINTLPEEAQKLLFEFLELLKKCYAKPESENQSEEKTLYEKFEEVGLIGCCSVEENLSTNYKQVLASTLVDKYDLS